ncbi:MAG TPA: OmpA family protein, partial [Bacteroidia bacterium]
TDDGKTMYFSSKGHNSMGGFDIFKSERNGDKWSEPVNLGSPINTPGDDIYFILAHHSDKAFYSSSSQAADSTKDMDIYSIDLCDDIPETVINGLAMGVREGKISVEELPGNTPIGSFEIADGKYSVKLKHGKNYKFTLNTSGIEPASVTISVPYMCKVYDVYQELSFSQPGNPLVYKNAFFDIQKEAGNEKFSDYLSKADKKTLTNYSEISVNTQPVTVATTSTVPTSTTVVTTASTTTVSAVQTGITASTTTTSPTYTLSATVSASTTASSTSGKSTVTTISINNVLFDYDKADIKAEFKPELDKVADFLKNTNIKAKIEVAGHTDSKGSDDYNLALSRRRADAVANYLATKGINRSRIKAIGYGETKPVASNENPDGSDNPDGRAKNRRTEIVVIQ